MKQNRILLYGISFLQGMIFTGSIATLYRQAAGITVFQITWIESVSFVLSLLLEIPWGYAADRIGYKNTLIVCCLLYTVSKVVFWQADSLFWFLMERILLAVALSGLSGCDSALLYRNTPKGQEKQVFGWYDSCNVLGLLAASLLYSMFLSGNYRLSALWTVASYGTAFALSLFLTDSRKYEHRRSRPAALRVTVNALWKDRSFLLLLLAAGFLAESSQTITVFLSQIQYVNSGIPAWAMGICGFLVTAAGLSSSLTQRLSRRISEKRLSRLLFLGAAGSCLLLALFQTPLPSLLGVLLLRASTSLFLPLRLSMQNQRVLAGNRATILSAHTMFLDFIAVFTNLFFGKAADFSLRLAMLFGFFLCLSGLLLLVRWQKGSLDPKALK